MAKALKLQHKGHSQRAVSMKFNTARRILRNYMKSKSAKRKLERSTVLNAPQERYYLKKRIIRFVEDGLPVTSLELRRIVFQEYLQISKKSCR